jgi:hypothetical protein
MKQPTAWTGNSRIGLEPIITGPGTNYFDVWVISVIWREIRKRIVMKNVTNERVDSLFFILSH